MYENESFKFAAQSYIMFDVFQNYLFTPYKIPYKRSNYFPNSREPSKKNLTFLADVR